MDDYRILRTRSVTVVGDWEGQYDIIKFVARLSDKFCVYAHRLEVFVNDDNKGCVTFTEDGVARRVFLHCHAFKTIVETTGVKFEMINPVAIDFVASVLKGECKILQNSQLAEEELERPAISAEMQLELVGPASPQERPKSPKEKSKAFRKSGASDKSQVTLPSTQRKDVVFMQSTPRKPGKQKK